ncbi:MAG: cbb3-type cytochrome oxidase assembly protein CcoS [Oligoflexales bacterium]|nr:cbb3-type cytochrome oxidase assembly protein CcoS [Oligoflexales bacterium]
MQIVYVLLPISLILATIGLFAFIWAIRNGQYQDLATPPELLVFDDKGQPKHNNLNTKEKESLNA